MIAITFRHANEGDATALGVVHVQSWRETYTGLLPDELLESLSIDERSAMWSATLRTPACDSATVFVAESSDGIVGFGACGRQCDETLTDLGFAGEIYAIYVLQSHQRAGIGNTLMRMMGRCLLNQGHRSASLWVLGKNTPARNFYEQLAGNIVSERTIELSGVMVDELAYGWSNLAVFGGPTESYPRAQERIKPR